MDIVQSHQQILESFAASKTTRYHTEAPVLQHDVAGHSWGVAALLAMLHPSPSGHLLTVALCHDLGERRGPGDVRFQVKRDNPDLKEMLSSIEERELARLGVPSDTELTPDDYAWFKFADMLEIALHTRHIYKTLGYPCALVVLKEALEVLRVRQYTLEDKDRAVSFVAHLSAEFEGV